jgi:uncharacterized DUF497 family protein
MHENRREIPGGRPAEPGRSSAGPGEASAGNFNRPAGPGERLAGDSSRPAGPGEDLAGHFSRPAGPGETSAVHISRSAVHIRRLAGNFAKPARPFRAFAGLPRMRVGIGGGYTLREERIRVISARDMIPRERKEYERARQEEFEADPEI